MGGIQTVACVALEFMAQMRCIVATALCRRAFGNEGQNASTQRGGYNIYEV